MIEVSLESVGLMAPGLFGWHPSIPILKGEANFEPLPLPPLKPVMLKPNERRRTTPTIKLALEVSDDALKQRPESDQLLSVFTSSYGDLDVIHHICRALTLDERPVSPTHFHNSVHNAPAGYWSIAAGYQQASSSIAGLDGSFAAGLLEAAVLCKTEEKSVLLIAYDLPSPEPLNQVIKSDATFATALLISPFTSKTDKLANLRLQITQELAESQLNDVRMEQLRVSAPAARSLPLLTALARKESTRLNLAYLADSQLQIEMTAC
jgi:hypothetical protein